MIKELKKLLDININMLPLLSPDLRASLTEYIAILQVWLDKKVHMRVCMDCKKASQPNDNNFYNLEWFLQDNFSINTTTGICDKCQEKRCGDVNTVNNKKID